MLCTLTVLLHIYVITSH